MSSIFQTLCDFFGISGAAPADFGEFIPWFMQVMLAICILWACWRMFRAIICGVTSGGRRL